MAQRKHLRLLKKGVDAWNAWRERNPDVFPVLPDVRLSGIDLSGVDLSEANLIHANLQDAILVGASLRNADLNSADLSGATLVGTDLTSADLYNTYLAGADLRGASFSGTNLFYVKLRDSNLTGARFNETVFAATDLSKAKGLKTCIHRGPSIIDHRTLQLSGQLPLSFLRGCGLPDNLIDYLPSSSTSRSSTTPASSATRPRMTNSLGAFADLQDRGIRCWFAPEDMKIGDRIRPKIDEVIRLHEKLLLVLSADSINSDWVEKEVETAFEKESETNETVLFPVRLDDGVMESKTGWAADIKRSRHIGDFRRWKDHDAYRKAFDRLLRDLKVEPET